MEGLESDQRVEQGEQLIKVDQIGLQARLLLAKEALDPDRKIDSVTVENLGIRDNIQEQIENHDYSALKALSDRERKSAWDSNFENNKRRWVEDTGKTIEGARKFFSSEEGKKWVTAVEHLGINLEESGDIVAKNIFDKYCAGNSNDSLKQFVKDVTAANIQEGKLNLEALSTHLEAYQWVAGMFGSNSAEVLRALIIAEANAFANPDKFTESAQKSKEGNDKLRINDLEEKEIKILDLLKPTTPTPPITPPVTEPPSAPEDPTGRRPSSDDTTSETTTPAEPEVDISTMTPEDIEKRKEELSNEIKGDLKEGEVTDEYVKKMLESEYDLKPIHKATIDGRTFYFTKVSNDGDRQDALVYTQQNGKFVPRLFYRSKSAGVWRATPYVENDDRYRKGGAHENDMIKWHYVQTTRPVDEMTSILESIAKNSSMVSREGWVMKDFMKEESIPHEAISFDEETKVFNEEMYTPPHKIAEFVRFRPSSYSQLEGGSGEFAIYEKEFGRKVSSLSEVFEGWNEDFFNSTEMQGFMPDFSNPAEEFSATHTLLGDVTMRRFKTFWQGKPIEWIMANDHEGRIWIDNIALSESSTNSYGIRSEFINAGALTNKPLEYTQYTTNLRPGSEKIPFHGTAKYDDITPVLEKLFPIKKYREQFKIPTRIGISSSASGPDAEAA